jgi:hypothetical protein
MVLANMSFIDLSLDDGDTEQLPAPVIARSAHSFLMLGEENDLFVPLTPSESFRPSRRWRSSLSQSARDPSGISAYSPTSPVSHHHAKGLNSRRTHSVASVDSKLLAEPTGRDAAEVS